MFNYRAPTIGGGWHAGYMEKPFGERAKWLSAVRKQIDCFRSLSLSKLSPLTLLEEKTLQEVRDRMIRSLQGENRRHAGDVLIAAIAHRSFPLLTIDQIREVHETVRKALQDQ